MDVAKAEGLRAMPLEDKRSAQAMVMYDNVREVECVKHDLATETRHRIARDDENGQRPGEEKRQKTWTSKQIEHGRRNAWTRLHVSPTSLDPSQGCRSCSRPWTRRAASSTIWSRDGGAMWGCSILEVLD